MKTTVKDGQACQKIIQIEVPAETISEEFVQMTKAYVKSATIPGFRKGRAPKHLVLKRYQKEINQDLLERLVPRFYHEALEKVDLKVIGVVDVTETEIKDGEPLCFDVIVDVEPDFKLPKYTDIPIAEKKETVTKKKIKEQIDAIRTQRSTFDDVDDQPVAEGDMAQITYSATIGEKNLEDVVPAAKGLGKGEGYWIAADEHAFLPGMGEAIVGMNVGDKKEVSVLFKADFAIRELAGVTALYKIEITGVRERKLPKLDKAFFEQVGVKSKEELEETIEKELEHQAEQQLLNNKQSQLFEYLLKKTTMELPESLVNQHMRNIVQDIARQRMMMGMTQEQVTEQKDELLETAKKQAEENLQLRYIGLKIAEKENLTVDEKEINKEIATMAIRQQKDARTLRQELVKENRLDTVGEQLRFEKAINFMLENAKIKK